MIKERNFCIGPWAEVRIDATGSMRYCHASDYKSVVESDNFNSQTIEDFQKGQTVSDAKNSIRSGSDIPGCVNCYKSESKNILSFRQRRNIQAAVFPGDDLIPSALEALPRMESWDKPRFYHISLSNLCNMACAMCDPKYSSLLTSHQQRAGIIDSTVPVLRDWTKSQEKWNEFVNHLLSNDHIECLHIMGGEPLYHKRFDQLLAVLIEHDHVNFSFTFVSNGSIYNLETVEKIKKFRSSTIELSVETLDSANDYIRYPSKWQSTIDNVKSYLEHRDDKFDVVLRPVPQLLSALGLTTLIDFALHHKVIIDHNVLESPDYMALNVLDDATKQNVIKNLTPYVKSYNHISNDVNMRDGNDIERSVSNHAQALINQISAPCANRQEKWNELVKFCKRMDNSRAIDVREYIPGLSDFFTSAGYESR